MILFVPYHPPHFLSSRLVQFRAQPRYPSRARAAFAIRMASVEALQQQWNQLYRTRLPSLAKAKDSAQPKWPVQLDHCFARIILDNAVGKDKPWTQVLKSPAYKNMSREQLGDAIELGEKLVNGEEDLVALDERSLAMRGKKSKQARTTAASKKRKADSGQQVEGEGDGSKRSRSSTKLNSSKRNTTEG